jgi:hypothetical protein
VGLVVTGISQGMDTSGIEQALRGAGLSLDPMTVFCAGEGRQEAPESGIRFIYTGTEDVRNLLGTGSAGIFSMGGTEVPGLAADAPSPEYFHQETLSEELSEIEIPDSELDNYVEALDAGHCLVAYYAVPNNLETVEAAFRGSGLAKVRTF